MIISQKKSKVALLMGYSGWDRKDSNPLSSLKDIDNYESFLMSDQGGCWEDTEIIKLQDETLYKVREELYKGIKYDFAFVVYSGHGCIDKTKGCHRFEINNNDDDDIFETDLFNLSDKLIFIYDSCSGLYTPQSEKLTLLNERLEQRRKLQKIDEIKIAYKEWYESCPNQQLRFYASQYNTPAYDREDGKGGEYSYELLNVLRNATVSMNIVKAHEIAKANLIRKFRYSDTNILQEPTEDITDNITDYLPGAIVL